MPFHFQRTQAKGSILVQFALLLILVITILGVVQIGYLYYLKRDLQRMADLAALEGIAYSSSCGSAQEASERSIDAQWSTSYGLSAEALRKEVDCLRWDASTGEVPGSRGQELFNAVKVRLKGLGLRLLPFIGNTEVYAEAIAAKKGDPIGAFTLGSGVAKLDQGALNLLLSMLLGTSVNLSLADYTGLANANVNLLGLMNALSLNVGNNKQLLSSKVSLRELLQANINVIENSPQVPTASVAVDALNRLLQLPVSLNLDSVFVSLFADRETNTPGLIDLGLYKDDPRSALAADISALNALLVGLQVANINSAVALQTTVNLAPLAEVGLKLKIIEPPVIAIGPPGYQNGVPLTSAKSGQVRVEVGLKALKPVGGASELLDLNLLLVRVKLSLPSGQFLHLPVYLEVADAEGHLHGITCYANGDSHAVDIQVKPGLVHVFLGSISGAFDNTNKSWNQLSKDLVSLLDLRLEVSALLGIVPVADAEVKFRAKLELPVELPSSHMVSFDYDPHLGREEQRLKAGVGMRKQLGSSIANALQPNSLKAEIDTSGLRLLGIKLDYLSDIVDGLVNNILGIVTALLPILKQVLLPVLSLLDGAVLGPLLSALGIEIGYADVELLWADCSPEGQLVQ